MLYSIRMRAAKGGAHELGGTHISGAERLVTEEELSKIAESMIWRALHHSKGVADFISLKIDEIKPQDIKTIPCLHIKNYEATSVADGLQQAQHLLIDHGISPIALEKGLSELKALAKNMRGAILLDAITGERLDQDHEKGVRVTHMDALDGKKFQEHLNRQGLTNIHVREALILASKVLSAPGVIAELCWSDDPDYVAGYVSYGNTYHRISQLKEMHSPIGGRLFFVEPNADVDTLIHYLSKQTVLVDIEEGYYDRHEVF